MLLINLIEKCAADFFLKPYKKDRVNRKKNTFAEISKVMKKFSIGFLFLFFWAGFMASAQKTVEKQNLLWTRYLLKVKVSDKYQIRQEVEERTYWFPWRQHQFVMRTLLERRLGKGWNVGGGFTYFLHSLPNSPDAEVVQKKLELRPQLEVIYQQNLSPKFSLQHRYWFEWRFYQKEPQGFEHISNRFRYRMEFSYVPHPKLTLKVFDEIHLHLAHKTNPNVFDQNRVGGSVIFMPEPNFGLELGYLNWFQQKPSGNDFFSRNITRITLHHTLNFAKK